MAVKHPTTTGHSPAAGAVALTDDSALNDDLRARNLVSLRFKEAVMYRRAAESNPSAGQCSGMTLG